MLSFLILSKTIQCQQVFFYCLDKVERVSTTVSSSNTWPIFIVYDKYLSHMTSPQWKLHDLGSKNEYENQDNNYYAQFLSNSLSLSFTSRELNKGLMPLYNIILFEKVPHKVGNEDFSVLYS